MPASEGSATGRCACKYYILCHHPGLHIRCPPPASTAQTRTETNCTWCCAKPNALHDQGRGKHCSGRAGGRTSTSSEIKPIRSASEASLAGGGARPPRSQAQRVLSSGLFWATGTRAGRKARRAESPGAALDWCRGTSETVILAAADQPPQQAARRACGHFRRFLSDLGDANWKWGRGNTVETETYSRRDEGGKTSFHNNVVFGDVNTL